MKKPITDRAEVAVDFPEKYYYGSFDRDATYDVKADDSGVHIELDRRVGEKRHVGFHLHFYLLAGVIESLAQALAKKNVLNESQRDAIERATDKLAIAIRQPGGKAKTARK